MNRGDLDAERRRCSLGTLEGDDWGEPTYNSHLVITCHRLRKKPIGTFTVEDLRIMIGQRIGLDFLVPLALEVLGRDPLAQGDFYPGDLLSALMRVGWEHRAAFVSAFNEHAVARIPDSGRQLHMREDGVVLELRTRAMDERDFWSELEGRVTAEMGRSGECRERGLWCDGFIADTFDFASAPARVLGTVWIGLGSGDQEAWTFELFLPPAVASREQLRWSDLLPPDGCSDWLDVDQERQHLVLRAVGSPGEA